MTIADLMASKAAPLNPHLALMARATKTKFSNVKTVIDGITFDSLKESRRYVYLKGLMIQGQITGLGTHKVFQLSVCKYIADFTYFKDNQLIVEDVKSKATKTATYRLKAKLMLNELNIKIIEV